MRKSQGFSLVELVIVLAIASFLLFLGVGLTKSWLAGAKSQAEARRTAGLAAGAAAAVRYNNDPTAVTTGTLGAQLYGRAIDRNTFDLPAGVASTSSLAVEVTSELPATQGSHPPMSWRSGNTLHSGAPVGMGLADEVATEKKQVFLQ